MKGLVLFSVAFLLLSHFSCNQSNTNSDCDNINIVVDQPIPIDRKIKATIHQRTTGKTSTHLGEIQRRGGFSISFPKHSYEMDLSKDLSLIGLPEDDDWILNANYIDKTFLRHVLSYELFLDMDTNNVAPLSKYIEVSVNNQYEGLYVLMEKLDKSTLQLKRDDTTSVIFKEPHLFRSNYNSLSHHNIDNFHQQTFPKFTERDKTGFLEEVRKTIITTNDGDFKNEISELFDLKNIIDWHLLLLISNNNDGVLKNFYLYKIDSHTPLRIAPWDYDHSFGRDGDNQLNLDERQMKIERSILFARLMKLEWYKQKIKDRWKELNSFNLLSHAGLKERVLKKSALIRPLTLKNNQRWPVNDSIYYDANNFDQEISIILQFLELRHQRLTAYFETL